jgi:hypothetical protein
MKTITLIIRTDKPNATLMELLQVLVNEEEEDYDLDVAEVGPRLVKASDLPHITEEGVPNAPDRDPQPTSGPVILNRVPSAPGFSHPHDPPAEYLPAPGPAE